MPRYDADKPYVQDPDHWTRADRTGAPPPIGSRVAYRSEGDLYAGTLVEYLKGDPWATDQRRAIVRCDNPWHIKFLDHFTTDLYVPTKEN